MKLINSIAFSFTLFLVSCANIKPVDRSTAYRDILYKGCMEAVVLNPHNGRATGDEFCTCSAERLAAIELAPKTRSEVITTLESAESLRPEIVRRMIIQMGRNTFVKCAKLGEANA